MARYAYGVLDYFNMLRLYFENNQQENRAAAAYQNEYGGRGNSDGNVILGVIDRLRFFGQVVIRALSAIDRGNQSETPE